MEVTEDYVVYSVRNKERGTSETEILLFAEGHAKEYGDCTMFENNEIFREYKNGKIFREYKNGKIVEEFKCTL